MALTVAGSDPSGGAGAELDLQVFARFGVHGTAVLTCLTDQDGTGLHDLTPVPEAAGLRRLERLRGASIRAAKVGLLPGAGWIEALGKAELPRSLADLVVDPVLAPTQGIAVHGSASVEAYRRWLLPRSTLCTPNLPEAAALLGETLDAVRGDPEGAARRLLELGARAVLLKGGHADAGAPTVVDRLRGPGMHADFEGERVPGPAVRGTGCALSAAIVASLARGVTLPDAVGRAIRFVRRAIAGAWHGARGRPILDIGSSNPD